MRLHQSRVISSGPQQFAIPNVIDATEEAAIALIEAGEFELGEITYRFSDTIGEGIVISQSPRPGTNGPPGTTVDIEVSSGPFALTVPEVALVSAETAIATLADASITNVTVVEEFSSQVLEGFVIRTEPGAGELVSRDRTVTIVVSLGPEPFELPNLVGLPVGDAQQLALDLGLIFVLEDDPEPVTADSGLDGLVAVQNPGVGTEVVLGDEVRVRIGTLIQREVPDLIGLTVEEAQAVLDGLGLVLEVLGDTPVEDQEQEGLIQTQSVEAGAMVDDGSVIQVTVGLFVPPPTDPPDPP